MNTVPKAPQVLPAEFLRIEDAMRILKLGRTSIHHRIKSGHLKVSYVGRLVRIHPDALQASLTSAPTKQTREKKPKSKSGDSSPPVQKAVTASEASLG